LAFNNYQHITWKIQSTIESLILSKNWKRTLYNQENNIFVYIEKPNDNDNLDNNLMKN